MPQSEEQREPAPFGITPRMAAVLSDPCRVQILEMLSRRPMSPSQFAREFGGDVSGLARRFRQLTEWGYTEVQEERSGRRGGASVERVYRLKRAPQLDMSAWDALQHAGRVPAKHRLLEPYVDRLAEAVDRRIFDQGVEHFSWDIITLDQVGWRRLGAQLEQVRNGLRPLQGAPSPGSPKRAGVSTAHIGLCLFRSPEPPFSRPRREKRLAIQAKAGAGPFIDLKFAKAASNKWRSRIMERLIYRPLSPSRFVEEQGGDPSYIARCFRELAALGFIEVVEERRGGRRGGIERIYKTSARVYFDDPAWAAIPPPLRAEATTAIVASFLTQLSDAVKTGSIDESGGHLSWSRLEVSAKAWQEVRSRLEGVFDHLSTLETEAFERNRDRPERLVRAIVGMTSFRVPRHP